MLPLLQTQAAPQPGLIEIVLALPVPLRVLLLLVFLVGIVVLFLTVLKPTRSKGKITKDILDQENIIHYAGQDGYRIDAKIVHFEIENGIIKKAIFSDGSQWDNVPPKGHFRVATSNGYFDDPPLEWIAGKQLSFETNLDAFGRATPWVNYANTKIDELTKLKYRQHWKEQNYETIAGLAAIQQVRHTTPGQRVPSLARFRKWNQGMQQPRQLQEANEPGNEQERNEDY